jgi:hypothetical protein
MDTQLLSYRLKSERQKKRLVKQDRDKQLLKLDRERRRISKDPGYKTIVPLDEPYQKGWKRLFVLKPEVQRSDKAEFYQQILDKINTVQYHYDRSFKKPKRKSRWHKYHFEELPKLQTIDRYDWHMNNHKLSEEQRACFERVEFWNDRLYAMDHRYRFAAQYLFHIAVLPHIISTVTIGDALLEQELAWIDNHIDNNNHQCRLDKLQNGNRYKGWKDGSEKLKHLNPLKNRAKWEWVMISDRDACWTE